MGGGAANIKKELSFQIEEFPGNFNQFQKSTNLSSIKNNRSRGRIPKNVSAYDILNSDSNPYKMNNLSSKQNSGKFPPTTVDTKISITKEEDEKDIKQNIIKININKDKESSVYIGEKKKNFVSENLNINNCTQYDDFKPLKYLTTDINSSSNQSKPKSLKKDNINVDKTSNDFYYLLYSCPFCEKVPEIVNIHSDTGNIDFYCPDREHGSFSLNISSYYETFYSKCDICNKIESNISNRQKFQYCCVCHKTFCSSCFEQNINHISNNKNINIESHLRECFPEILKNQRCLKHFKEKKLLFYCLKCNENICIEELFSKHKNHPKRAIDSLVVEESEIETIKSKIEELKKLIDIYTIILETYLKYPNNYFYRLNVMNLSDLIKKERNRNINELQKFIEKVGNKLEFQQKAIDDLKKLYKVYIDGKEKELDLNNRAIDDKALKMLSKVIFKNLEYLNLSNNKISNIEELENFQTPQLKIINLSKNEIRNINPLKKFSQNVPKLEEINLDDNKIRNIDVLKENIFPKLQRISLQNNDINFDLSDVRSIISKFQNKNNNTQDLFNDSSEISVKFSVEINSKNNKSESSQKGERNHSEKENVLSYWFKGEEEGSRMGSHGIPSGLDDFNFGSHTNLENNQNNILQNSFVFNCKDELIDKSDNNINKNNNNSTINNNEIDFDKESFGEEEEDDDESNVNKDDDNDSCSSESVSFLEGIEIIDMEKVLYLIPKKEPIKDNKEKVKKLKLMDMKFLGLSNEGLESFVEIKKNKINKTIELNLTENNISDLNIFIRKEVTFNFLEILNLSYNKIIDITIFKFDIFPLLEKLVLSNNKITDVFVFKPLNIKKLKHLFLQNNSINYELFENIETVNYLFKKGIHIYM